MPTSNQSETPNPKSAISRLAPSPTGYLHLGNARSFLLAWLWMRSIGGRIILRIEDLDQARAVRGAADDIVRDLAWLGLDWDNDLTPDYFQSNRFDRYHAALDELRRRDLVYECFCSRKELREIASAPHGQTEPRYPGTCRSLSQSERDEKRMHKTPSLRIRVEPGTRAEFVDAIVGQVSEDVSEAVGDFIVARADGVPSYQLAVVLDDIAMNITHVLRGDDLLSSTPRQIVLWRTFDAEPPIFAHVPLILGPDGERLAKRHGAVSLAELRADGRSAEDIVGWLAWSCGLCSSTSPCRAGELIADFSPSSLINRQSNLLSDP